MKIVYGVPGFFALVLGIGLLAGCEAISSSGGPGSGAGGDGGDGGVGPGGSGGDAGGTAGEGGSGGGGGMGGTGGSPAGCESICQVLEECGWRDSSDHTACIDWCGSSVPRLNPGCFLGASRTCNGIAGCLNDHWCDGFCANYVTTCFPASAQPAARECRDACIGRGGHLDWLASEIPTEENGWRDDPVLRSCLEAAAPSCDPAAFGACFNLSPACTSMCNHAYFGCGVELESPASMPMNWNYCETACQDLWTADEVACATASACDPDSLNGCFATSCDTLCTAVAACSTADTPTVQASCFHSCEGYWSLEPSTIHCISSAAAACDGDVTAIDACNPADGSEACYAACNHVNLGCGLGDAFYADGLDARICPMSCYVGTWSTEQIACLATAPCTTAEIRACLDLD